LNREDSKKCEESLAFVDQWLEREGAFDADIKAVKMASALLPKLSLWTVAGDGWGNGSDTPGLHNFLACGADTNVMLLATDPSRDDASIPTTGTPPRRDLGLYALNYGGVYVASCSPATHPEQAAAAMAAAASYPGPSLVVCLTSSSVAEAQAAIDSGSWPLYRWDPRLDSPTAGEEGGAMTLDSPKLRKDLADFVARDSRFALLASSTPTNLPPNETLEGVASNTVSVAATPTPEILDASFSRLMGALQLPTLHILFASDGGNAEGVARRLGGEAKRRGFPAVNISTLDAAVTASEGKDGGLLGFLGESKNVIFVVSTAGQGEFPGNGRAFAKTLAAAAADVKENSPPPLSSLSFAVFGLGDSHYWPRKEHAHFFNKPSIDLHSTLASPSMGARPLTPRGSGDDQSVGGFNADLKGWLPGLWASLGVSLPEDNSGDGGGASAARTRAPEAIKPTSNYLRGTIAQGLKDTSTGALSYEDTILTKFHGIYQQDDRDIRPARKRAGLEPAYSFMVRVRIPGGVATPSQYLALDTIADTQANGTLRLTTRQAIQFHGIVKGVLKPAIAAVNRALMDTLAACGDVNRNVMASPLPSPNATLQEEVLAFSRTLSDRLTPRTTAYHEIWMGGEVGGHDGKGAVLVGGGGTDFEPLYGPTYLPRKFKVACAIPPYNDVDAFTQDMTFIAHENTTTGALEGFTITAGGGMGMTHNAPATFPCLGRDLCFATPQDALRIAEACVTTQRDFGDRTNRRHARFKYTVDDRGIEWLRGEVESRTGLKLAPPRPYVFKSNGDVLGWTPGPAGTSNYTLFVQNGRIVDKGSLRLKSGLVALALLGRDSPAALGMNFRLTPNQNIMIAGIPAGPARVAVEGLLAEYGLENTAQGTGLRLNSMACVALPTCGLSLAEAERYLPKLLDRLDIAVCEAGLRDDAIVIRMTGCPNGCARPYVAEVGLVGRSPGIYNLYLGAGFSGERMNKLYKEDVDEEAIVGALTPLFKRYALERKGKDEHFGDWCVRAGVVKATLSGRTFHEL